MKTHKHRLNFGISKGAAALLLAGLMVGGLGLTPCLGQENTVPVLSQEDSQSKATEKSFDYLAIAIVVSVACSAAGYAVAKVGSAAIGAIVEKPELTGRALIFVGLAEGIAIYGLIFGILLLKQL